MRKHPPRRTVELLPHLLRVECHGLPEDDVDVDAVALRALDQHAAAIARTMQEQDERTLHEQELDIAGPRRERLAPPAEQDDHEVVPALIREGGLADSNVHLARDRAAVRSAERRLVD